MSVSYTLRLPDDLKRLIDSAAKSGGVSTAQLVVDACWKYLERDSSVVEQRPHKTLDVGSNPIPATIPPVKMNNAMAEFLAKASIQIPVMAEEVVELCHQTSPYVDADGYSDGETYRCGLRAGHKGRCTKGAKV